MYQKGHLGASLLVYAPLGFVAAALGGFEVALLGGAIAVALASVPDLDMRVPLISHRGPTHTVWFAVIVGLLVGVGGIVYGLQFGLLAALGFAIFAGVVGTLSIISHLLADALTPMGIQPLTPVSSTNYSWDLVKAKNPIANYALLGLGAVVAGGAVYAGMLVNSLL